MNNVYLRVLDLENVLYKKNIFLKLTNKISSFHTSRHFIQTAILAFLAIFCLLVTVNAQKRDNLTSEEDMLVRDAQEIDARMKVFVKVVDRRLLALTAPESKLAQKESDKWGALRTGTREVLLFDIQKTIDEAIAKIDDAAEREQKNPLFPKAVRILAEGCERFITQLQAIKTEEQKERAFQQNSIDACNQVIEATARLPKEVEAKEEKKKKN